MHKVRGITLIELMVGLAIMALLATLAGPPFVRLIKSNSVSAATNTFMADARFARSEAVRRSARVVMCRSDAPEAATPVCAANAGTSGRGWATGWVIFEDRTGSANAFDAGDTILRVQGPITSLDAILESPATASTVLPFTATGRLHSSASAAKLVFGGADYDSKLKRVLCLGVSGRARVAGDGSTDCGANNT